MLKRHFGDRAFYRHFLSLAIPMIIQNGITNFVSLLDNIMVGQIGTMPMSGVSIVNGLLLVFNLCIFSASSGPGIFTAQFQGCGDVDGIRYTLRFKVILCSLLAVLGVFVFFFADELLIGLYLTGEGDAAMAAESMKYGIQYLRVMLLGLLPFALTNAYASTLRETGETRVPMAGGIVAVFVNLILNYVLIFGHLGAPRLGVEGAALATVISRFVELAIVAGWTHLNPQRNPFIRYVFRSLHIPRKLFRDIMVKGFPLLINEFFWASGMAILNQCYSTCGLDVVPAMNIASTLYNLGSVVHLALGNCVGIIMGQLLGAGKAEAEIRDTNRKLITAAVLGGAALGLLMMAFSTVFPLLYNTTPEIRSLAAALICINGIYMGANSYTNATYYTVRSGGQTAVVFLFDSCFVCGFCVPLAYVLSRFTDMPIIPLYIICHGTDVIKCFLGGHMLRQGKWIKNLTK